MKKVRNKTRTKEFPQGKPSVDFSVGWMKIKIEQLEREYKEVSENYVWMVQQGVGLTNIHVLDSLRRLTYLYTTIAAHHDAIRSLKVEV